MKKTSDAEKIFRQNANLNPASFCLLSEVMTELKHTKKVLCLLMFCQKTVCVCVTATTLFRRGKPAIDRCDPSREGTHHIKPLTIFFSLKIC